MLRNSLRDEVKVEARIVGEFHGAMDAVALAADDDEWSQEAGHLEVAAQLVGAPALRSLRQIALRLSKMSAPANFAQEAKAVEVAAMAGSAYVKLSEQKAKLFGLNAAKPEVATTSITNNLLAVGGDELTYLKNLTRLKELENGRG